MQDVNMLFAKTSERMIVKYHRVIYIDIVHRPLCLVHSLSLSLSLLFLRRISVHKNGSKNSSSFAIKSGQLVQSIFSSMIKKRTTWMWCTNSDTTHRYWPYFLTLSNPSIFSLELKCFSKQERRERWNGLLLFLHFYSLSLPFFSVSLSLTLSLFFLEARFLLLA